MEGQHGSRRGWGGGSDPVPGHAADATDGLICDLGERSRGEVEVGDLASLAAVGHSDGDTLALVYEGNRPCKDLCLTEKSMERSTHS